VKFSRTTGEHDVRIAFRALPCISLPCHAWTDDTALLPMHARPPAPTSPPRASVRSQLPEQSRASLPRCAIEIEQLRYSADVRSDRRFPLVRACSMPGGRPAPPATVARCRMLSPSMHSRSDDPSGDSGLVEIPAVPRHTYTSPLVGPIRTRGINGFPSAPEVRRDDGVRDSGSACTRYAND
jgi:hypothetical protein